MTVWSHDGNTLSADVRGERNAAGTVGGEMVQPQGLLARGLNAIIDDTDTRILYGGLNGSANAFVQDQNNLLNNNMTQTIIGGRGVAYPTGVSGSAAQLKFKGTSIGVMGGTNPYSGVMSVFIDGVAAAGRLPVYIPIYIGNGGANIPALNATDTTIVAYGTNAGFLSSGTVLIGSELITYSGISTDGNGNYNFTGCTRGALGTTAQQHFASESIFAWASTIDLSTATDYSTKQLLYYNPLLSPGDHTITISVTVGNTGYSRIYFDGFITGSLVGAQNLFTQTGTVTVSVITDANGHGTLGNLFYPPSNVTLIGMLGYTQTSTETSNATAMAKVGITRSSSYTNGETWPFFYIHNGPPSTTVTLIFTFTYIGETI
jgi:hypothetical protein